MCTMSSDFHSRAVFASLALSSLISVSEIHGGKVFQFGPALQSR